MKKSIFVLFLIILFISKAYSQTTEYSGIGKNGIYLEVPLIRGSFTDGYGSINYERIIGEKKKKILELE